MEKLVECPTCHQKQIENKSAYCSFCYASFKNNELSEKSHRTGLINNHSNIQFQISEKNKKIVLVAFFLNIIITLLLASTLLSSSQTRFIVLTIGFDIFSAAIILLLVINKKNQIKAFYGFIACFLLSPLLISFTNLVLSYPEKAYKVNVIRKYTTNGKNGKSYWLEVTNWKNSTEKIKLKEYIWEDIEENSTHILKAKKGGLGLDIYLNFF